MVLTLLIAFFTSGVVSAVVSFYLSSRREEILLRRQKLETLFKALTQWCKTYGVVLLNFRFAMGGKLDLSYVYKEMENISIPEEKDNLETVEMIVGVYFPNLRPHYDAIISARERSNKIIGDFEREAKNNSGIGHKYVDDLDTEMKKFETEEAQFKKAIFEESEVLLSPPWRKWINS